MKIKSLVGLILSTLVISSAFLSVCGVWGVVKGEVAAQLIATFFIIGATTIGLSYVANSFFKE